MSGQSSWPIWCLVLTVAGIHVQSSQQREASTETTYHKNTNGDKLQGANTHFDEPTQKDCDGLNEEECSKMHPICNWEIIDQDCCYNPWHDLTAMECGLQKDKQTKMGRTMSPGNIGRRKMKDANSMTRNLSLN